jgi:ferredoxin
MGYWAGEVLHLAQAGARGLGESDPGAVPVVGDQSALEFGPVCLPKARWFFRAVPSWAGAPLHWAVQLRPGLDAAACAGCGRCTEVCPNQAIAPGRPPRFDLDRCIGCLCCAEVCPRGAIQPRRNAVVRIAGDGATRVLRRFLRIKAPW